MEEKQEQSKQKRTINYILRDKIGLESGIKHSEYLLPEIKVCVPRSFKKFQSGRMPEPFSLEYRSFEFKGQRVILGDVVIYVFEEVK